MPLFKEKIIKEQKQDEKIIEQRYANLAKFQAKIEQIKEFKEEEYQTDFLHDIFEACLGYTLKTSDPQHFNLQRESKNETDSKKADGAILNANGEVIGVIELKDQKSKDLDKIENQAFNYHNSNSKSRYIIISNFDEIRLYIDKKTAYEKFSLFSMTRKEFELFHQILCFENINSFKTIDLRDKSESYENEISKKLYADFAEFRLKLFENAVKENPQIPQKEILSLIQKLCDRIIFVLFAEDSGLLKPNSVAEINSEFKNQKFTDFSLYKIWQIYFDAIDKGNAKLGIDGYNGGLFATDETLNSLKFSDEILQSYIAKLSSYDFASDIGVNILGHIFEQSLSDLEELNSQIVGDKFDKKDSKRKKDGIFYTPEYIVKFIISQTLGQICENKKAELELNGEIIPPKNPKKLSKSEKQTLQNIYAYRDFLLNLKIIDPACGSGAFLNGVLEFLINEHKNLDKIRRIYENEALKLYDIEPIILENNLYGVDINADAVQIAKLSLWLRTAEQGRKLTNLSNNIVTADSLLELPNFIIPSDGEEARVSCHSERSEESQKSNRDSSFASQTQNDEKCGAVALYQNDKQNKFSNFPTKFDAVIGNPPYVRQEMIKEQKPHLQKLYKAYSGTADLFVYFYELGLNLLKNGGLLGFICSNKFFRASYGQNLRELILQNSQILAIADFNGVKVFDDATVDSAITILQKNSVNSKIVQPCHCEKNEVFRSNPANGEAVLKSNNAENSLDCFDDKSSRNDSIEANTTFKLYSPNLQDFQILQTANLKGSGFIFLNPLEANLKAKIERLGTPLKDWDININYGIKTGLNEAFIIDEATRTEILSGCESVDELERTKAIIKPILRGRDIKRYTYSWAGLYLINFHNGYKSVIARSDSDEAIQRNSDKLAISKTASPLLDCFDGETPSRNDKEIPPLDIADFPSLKKHFDKFEPALSKRTDKGATPYNLRNCAYLEEFEKEKIIWAELARTGNAFTFDKNNFSLTNTAYALTTNSENLKYILCFLNSKITLKFLDIVSAKLDETGWRWLKQNLEKIPIPKISKEKEAEFVNLIDKILEIKKQKEISKDDEITLKVLEKELENKIFALYELNEAEIAAVTNNEQRTRRRDNSDFSDN